jgi:hypothetical protein
VVSAGFGRKYLMSASSELPLMSVITNMQKIKDQDRLRKKEIEKTKEEIKWKNIM